MPVEVGTLPDDPTDPADPSTPASPTPPTGFASSLQDGAVSLGDLTFGVVDEDGVPWYIETLDGWDTNGSSGSVDQRVAGPGGYLNSAFATPRVVMITLSTVTDSYGECSRALDKLFAQVSISALTKLVVTESTTREMQTYVRQSDEPGLTRRGGFARVTLSLVAPDPRRYSTALQSPATQLKRTSGGLRLPLTLPLTVGATVVAGSITVLNTGNDLAPVLLQVTGPCPAGATITLRGRGDAPDLQRKVLDVVPAGRVLSIGPLPDDPSLLDDSAYRVVKGLPFALPPGASEISFDAPTSNPDALLTALYRSTWR